MLYIFDHVFKTAGTSFNLSYLPAAFKPEEVFVLRGSRQPNREDVQRVIRFTPEEKSRLKVIAGHNTGQLRPYYPEARFLSLVREPVARSTSAYLHAKHHEDAWGVTGQRIQEGTVSLAAYLEANWMDREYNHQSELLLGAEFSRNGVGGDAEVTKMIRSRFLVVGYSEALELFIFYLHVTENFPLALFNNRLVRKERATFRPTAEDLAMLDRYNQVDRKLYRCARTEFDSKVAKIWTSETEWLYRKYLEALDSYRIETQGNFNVDPVQWPFSSAYSGA